MMPSDLKERLQYVRKTFKFKSRNEMASTLGIENLRMQNLENGRSKHLFVEEAMLFQAVLKINPWWIMSGHGNMLLSDDKKNEILYTEAETKIKLLFPVDGRTHIVVDKLLLSGVNSTPAELRAMTITDDSMSPSFNIGDFALIDTSKKLSLSGLYAILIGDKFAINRISVRADNQVEISYDNPSYKPYCTNKDDIDILGKIILSVSRK